MELLRQIEQHGSLRQAAEELGISYRKAYYRIYSMNKAAKQPVVELKRGGKNGGVSEITTYGKELMKEYEKIEKQLTDFIQNCKFETVN
jgi:molybdate transport system regulatory protein